MTDTAPNPPTQQHRSLLIPWFLSACLFIIAIAIAIFTMVRGMLYAQANQSLPAWYHPLLTISQYGLFLSTAAIIILVAISFRRAFKSK